MQKQRTGRLEGISTHTLISWVIRRHHTTMDLCWRRCSVSKAGMISLMLGWLPQYANHKILCF